MWNYRKTLSPELGGIMEDEGISFSPKCPHQNPDQYLGENLDIESESPHNRIINAKAAIPEYPWDSTSNETIFSHPIVFETPTDQDFKYIPPFLWPMWIWYVQHLRGDREQNDGPRRYRCNTTYVEILIDFETTIGVRIGASPAGNSPIETQVTILSHLVRLSRKLDKSGEVTRCFGSANPQSYTLTPFAFPPLPCIKPRISFSSPKHVHYAMVATKDNMRISIGTRNKWKAYLAHVHFARLEEGFQVRYLAANSSPLPPKPPPSGE
jgi:hypothetical protein